MDALQAVRFVAGRLPDVGVWILNPRRNHGERSHMVHVAAAADVSGGDDRPSHSQTCHYGEPLRFDRTDVVSDPNRNQLNRRLPCCDVLSGVPAGTTVGKTLDRACVFDFACADAGSEHPARASIQLRFFRTAWPEPVCPIKQHSRDTVHTDRV